MRNVPWAALSQHKNYIHLGKRNYYELTCKMEPHQMPFTDLYADSVKLHRLVMKKISDF